MCSLLLQERSRKRLEGHVLRDGNQYQANSINRSPPILLLRCIFSMIFCSSFVQPIAQPHIACRPIPQTLRPASFASLISVCLTCAHYKPVTQSSDYSTSEARVSCTINFDTKPRTYSNYSATIRRRIGRSARAFSTAITLFEVFSIQS